MPEIRIFKKLAERFDKNYFTTSSAGYLCKTDFKLVFPWYLHELQNLYLMLAPRQKISKKENGDIWVSKEETNHVFTKKCTSN